MSMRTLEKAILEEARKVTGNKKLKMKEIMEWSSGDIVPHPGEIQFRLPKMGVNIAIIKEKPAAGDG